MCYDASKGKPQCLSLSGGTGWYYSGTTTLLKADTTCVLQTGATIVTTTGTTAVSGQVLSGTIPSTGTQTTSGATTSGTTALTGTMISTNTADIEADIIDVLNTIDGIDDTTGSDLLTIEDGQVALSADTIGERVVKGIVLTTSNVQAAITFLFDNGATKFETEAAFKPSDSLRRDAAAVFFGQFAKEVFGQTPDTSLTMCTQLKDFADGYADRKQDMIDACQLGLLKGSNGSFLPKQQLTQAQAVTVLMRLINGSMDEPKGDFAVNYRTLAKKLGLTKGLALDTKANFNKPITRGEVARLLEAAYVLVQVKQALGVTDMSALSFDGTVFTK